MLTSRVHTPEFMDDPGIARDELRGHLRFLRMVNRRLGGTRAALRHFKRWSRQWPRHTRASSTHSPTGSVTPPSSGKEHAPIRILDVGTGSADIPVAIARWAQRSGFDVHITAIDLHPLTVELAREHVAAAAANSRCAAASSLPVDILQLDALRLMDHFTPESFDYAHAGMFLHHLDDIEVVTVLRIMDRMTTRGVIWNDGMRSAVSRVGVRILSMAAPPMLRHDAIVSIDKSFTKREAMDLASRAGLARVRFRRHLFGRFTLTSEKGNRR